MITKRPGRLKGVDYCGFNRYFTTICTPYRGSLFVSSDVVEEVRSQLQTIADSHGFSVPAYCFMPDHLHALLDATVENADFQHCVKTFKQVSSYRYKRRYGTLLWQSGYHERILRDEETTAAVARYIWENPIRAGLAKGLGEYPFCGSDRYTVADILELWQDRRT